MTAEQSKKMSEAEGTALTERQRYWLDRVQACRASGKTVIEYAAEHDLAAQAMYAGKRLAGQERHPAFLLSRSLSE